MEEKYIYVLIDEDEKPNVFWVAQEHLNDRSSALYLRSKISMPVMILAGFTCERNFFEFVADDVNATKWLLDTFPSIRQTESRDLWRFWSPDEFFHFRMLWVKM